MKIGLQIMRFDWPGGSANMGATLAEIGRTADEAGIASFFKLCEIVKREPVRPLKVELVFPPETARDYRLELLDGDSALRVEPARHTLGEVVRNVGKEPETRYLDESTAITKFPMATSETYKNKNGERVSTTEWHNIVLWRGLAQVAEKYVKKGTQIYVEGRIKTCSYDDADGNKKYITEIVGDQMTLLGRKPEDGAGGQAQGGAQAPAAEQAPAAGQTPAQADNAGGQQTPSAQPGDTFDGGDNGPDDLPF